ncbi:RNA methyltransferase [Lacihabitans sp. LS3-19]|uniref:RsmB/NOP family class I SAM-dependent RNA methyltransferase n=1 Tax=Lacihabitans sp. LS3-19 TaxID=2487335 RepID=UPI0020CC9601|nr:RsmB/NOP family class I SAM-dependent RNA methyltransferase [Lacihabitans sp. LS3-19]MCP9770011.1 RNA methyltransferase [Lacihabitans sp. LS3-19]
MTLPEKFIENMQTRLGEALPDFQKALDTVPPVSIRFNPAKSTQKTVLEIEETIPWSENGRYLKSRPVFTLDPAFHAGAYYVQEASSMFLEHVFKQVVHRKGPIKVLDLCAAPGGKTTLLASLLGKDDFLVANEVVKNRLGILKENLSKWGFNNLIISNQDPETFSDLEGFFDVVLVDAPCSGEGMFRKDLNARNEWSEAHVQMCSARQRRILSAAAMLVAPNGVLIYSTCTFNEHENHDNVKWLNRTLDFETLKIETPDEWNIEEKENGFQFFPHRNKGEGFFIATMKNLSREARFVKGKPDFNRLKREQRALLEAWIKPEVFSELEFYYKNDGNIIAMRTALLGQYGSVLRALSKRSSGFEIGIFKGKDFVPSHAFALSDMVSGSIKRLELEEKEALKFLKKENFDFEEGENGWLLVTYGNLGLGWIKKIGDRMNNYLPTEWRIRMEVE